MSMINLNSSNMDIMVNMSKGNPGAITAMMECLNDNETDPDSFLKGAGAIVTLDSLEIYGTDIYVLWSDICEKDSIKMQAVLRGYQLGIVAGSTLKDACSRQDYSGKKLINVEEIYKGVCDMLPNFDKKNRKG